MVSSMPPAPPTPHQQPHIMSAASPSNAASQHAYPPPPSSYAMSFDSSFPGSQPQTYPRNISAAGPGGPVTYSRSFGDYPSQQPPPPPGAVSGPVSTPGPRAGYRDAAQIYTAVYSGVSVYEMEIQGIACMRRRSDGWLNATQILKVAGVDKGKRTKVLEKEILTGEHEKVQGGYGKYQGTWISYKRGREFCRQYGVEDILRPLLDYDVSSDGSGGAGQGQQETPTKEQAMAANRKRFYTTSVENTRAGSSSGVNGPISNGTFFNNISPSTSVALAAMNKAARLNSPAPRPGGMRRPSQSDAFPGGSQQSIMSESSFTDSKYIDSGYGTQPNGEPPRKRLRPDSQDGSMVPQLPLDSSMRSATPTEPNESFVYDGTLLQDLPSNGTGEPVALPPLPNPTTDTEQDRKSVILDLFAEAGRTDYTNHPALSQLSGEDFNIPLDASANNALHWAATLAKVSLLKLLIQKGANIYRGNAAGQSPLISAVLVNNCWEHSSFPDLLELLGPLIEIRDLQGRTILHHIAVSSGIKGRNGSSKYYLEALLEFLVRIGNNSSNGGSNMDAATFVASSQQDGIGGTPVPTAPVVQSARGPVTLVRFLSHIVNARDKAGNTALNLVARVGNRSIIQQLIEIHADPALPNYKGVSAKDFGVGVDGVGAAYVNGNGTQGSLDNDPLSSSKKPPYLASGLHTSSSTQETATEAPTGTGEEESSQVEEIGEDVLSTITTLLNQSLASHKDLLRARTEQIDALNAEIRADSAAQQRELETLQVIRERVRVRGERMKRIERLRGRIAEMKARGTSASKVETDGGKEVAPEFLSNERAQEILETPGDDAEDPSPDEQQELEPLLPPAPVLRRLVNAYQHHNNSLEHQAAALHSRSAETEAMYRKVVALCTGVEEARLEADDGALLGSLLRAVESEHLSADGPGAQGMGMAEGEVGRVREFLRRVGGS